MKKELIRASMFALSILTLSACDSQQPYVPSVAPILSESLPDSVVVYFDEENRRLDLATYITHTRGLPLAFDFWQVGTSAEVSLDGTILTIVPTEIGTTDVYVRAMDDSGQASEDSLRVHVLVPQSEGFDYIPFRAGYEWTYEHRMGDSDDEGRWVQEGTVSVRTVEIFERGNRTDIVLDIELIGRRGSTSWERDSLVWRPVHSQATVSLEEVEGIISYPLYISHLPFDSYPRMQLDVNRYHHTLSDTLVIKGTSHFKEGRYSLTLVRGKGIVEEDSFGCTSEVIPQCWGGRARLLSSDLTR